MSLSIRELWTALHGLILGALLLLSFVGVLAELYSLRQRWVTLEGLQRRIRYLKAWSLTVATISWATVITGTYIALPWYRAQPPNGGDLLAYPQFLLLSRPETKSWHTFAAEWKEHVGWFAPVLMTTVAYLVAYYGPQLVHEDKIRRALLWTGVLAFVITSIAGLIGAFLNKVAPIR
jgi:hypothetical protein